MEKWYPAHGKWNWDAPGNVEGTSRPFNQQIAWLKALNIPVLYTLNDELSKAMLNPDGTLNYDEIAFAWAGHIKHLIDEGVNIQFVEIGNECDIAPGEGIQYPPVDFSNGSDQLSGSKYLELHIGEEAYANGSNEYIKLWEAVVPAIRAAAPGVKISPYPSGQGTQPSLSFPFDYLFRTAKAKPDFLPVHVYSFAAYTFIPSPQQLLDSTWQYSGRFMNWDGDITTLGDTLAGYGAAGLPTGITEWNYDGATQYDPGQGVNWGASQANSMWDAVYAASVLANASNGGMDLTTFWETFPGSNTDELFDEDYMSTTPRSQALAFELMKQFGGGVVQASTVTSSDQAVAYDWENTPVIKSGLAGVRVECLATSKASGHRLLLINKNVNATHTAAVSIAGAGTSDVSVSTYTTRASLANGTPALSTTHMTNGAFQASLPPMSISIVTVGGESPPPSDTTAPSVALTSPSDQATVSGTVPLSANASDPESAIQGVEFLVDGTAVGADTGTSSPYVAAWDAVLATPGTHTITAKATNGAGLTAFDSVSVTVPGVLPPDPPVAEADFYKVDEDSALTVSAPGVLANDTTAAGRTKGAVVVSEPKNGELTPYANGAFVYRPAADFHGDDSFTYRVFDGEAFSDPAIVSISVRSVAEPAVLKLLGPSTPPAYNAPAKMTATIKRVTGASISGQMVIFERWDGKRWVSAGNATASGGTATWSTPRLTSTQSFRARFSDAAEYTAPPTAGVAVKPHAYLSNPIAPTYASRGRGFTAYGYMRPRHTRGSYPVRIYRYRYTSGGWRRYGYVNARAYDYHGYTRFACSVALPYRGRWCLRAYAPADSGHAATWSSGYDYVKVR